MATKFSQSQWQPIAGILSLLFSVEIKGTSIYQARMKGAFKNQCSQDCCRVNSVSTKSMQSSRLDASCQAFQHSACHHRLVRQLTVVTVRSCTPLSVVIHQLCGA